MADNLVAVSLISGGMAGTCTDLFFFPIDTLKTRLQAKGGFFANGGWAGVYRGVGSAIVASAPGASLFFLSYEAAKKNLLPVSRRYIENETVANGIVHMAAASLGEIAACSVRVPAEVIKQRTQAAHHPSSFAALMSILRNTTGEGVWLGLYRGWGSTILREIPFTVIQFPLYEYLKLTRARSLGIDKVAPNEGAVCGMIAGGTAAAITTPLDVIKTRLMLHKTRTSIFDLAVTILKEEGPGAFLKGIGPRTMWISAGGAIFLGVYESVKEYAGRAL
ncbi:succinate/fumarate mitochondrial transporter [Trichomonascus vanleenenianus]|uniref:Pet8p n=1 Tax=Trichomonascus vanleenenianus TaxID=2268995 RepID=UPI003ECB4BAA